MSPKLSKKYLIAGMSAGLALAGCNSKDEKPNIIFIMSDDHTKQAISAYGSQLNETPNIDRIANEGITFTSSSVTNAISAPSRAVLLTGKHSHMNGHIDNSVSFDGSQQTFPKLLQQNGYQTALVGKWHLKSEPTGFDYWNILPGQGHYYNPDFIEMGEKKREDGYVTDIITEKTINWLEKRDKEKPFCLLLHHKAPHRNWMPHLDKISMYDTVEFPLPETFFDDYKTRGTAARTQEMEIANVMYDGYDLKISEGEGQPDIFKDGLDHSYRRMTKEQYQHFINSYKESNDAFHRTDPKGEELAKWKYQRYMHDYLATVASVDESVGQVLDYLEKEGLTENTIIVYTSDQGFYLGEHGWFDKRFMYKESFEMPLLIKYPKLFKRGEVCDKLIQNLDFAPTFLDLAGVAIPDDMQGESFVNLLSEKQQEWRDAAYYHYYEYPGIHSVKRHEGVQTERYKLIHFYYDVDEWELYDLKEDPQELLNLFHKEEYLDIKNRLIQKLSELKKEYKVPSTEMELSYRAKDTMHIARGIKVSLKNAPSDKYSTKGVALTDGKMHIFNKYWMGDWSGWEGFEGDDLVAIIDLGKQMEVKEIASRYLDNKSSWIYLPSEVKYEVSKDGKEYIPVEEVAKENVNSYNDQNIFQYKVKVNKEVRYIKVIAINKGVLPDDHPGSGNPAWLFCDEIIVI